MKSTKMQSNTGLNKKEISEKNGVPNIQKYFKSTPKTFVIENKQDIESDPTRTFYIEVLKKKLKVLTDKKQDVNECVTELECNTSENRVIQQEDGACAIFVEEENDIRSNQINNVGNDSKSLAKCTGCDRIAIAFKDLEIKHKELKAKYFKLAAHNSELHLKYEDLLKAVISSDHQDVDVDDEATSNWDGFTTKEIKILQNMPLEKNKDSSFILKCLEYAYKTDPTVLCMKTLKGKPEWVKISDEGTEILHAEKTPLTPKKVNRIKDLFTERVAKTETDSVDHGERITESYVNKLFAWGVTNISKKQK